MEEVCTLRVGVGASCECLVGRYVGIVHCCDLNGSSEGFDELKVPRHTEYTAGSPFVGEQGIDSSRLRVRIAGSRCKIER